MDIVIIEKSLSLLGSLLERRGALHFHLIVCGGSSLIITGLAARPTTRDVDILGIGHMSDTGYLLIEEPAQLPEPIEKAKEQVARDLGLENHWLNHGPSSLVKFGLPAGLTERLHTRNYGKCLTISFVDRIDQIHFKVYAAADSGPGRHVDDLMTLKPTEEEIETAARWTLTHDPSEGFRLVLIQMLKTIGYEKVAEKL